MDIRYIAGFFDGEGCVALAKNGLYRKAALQITNTDRTVLEKIKETLRCGHICITRKFAKTKPQWAQAYSFSVNKRRDVIEVLQKMLPYLEVKHEAGQKLLDTLLSKSSSHLEWTPDEKTFLCENYKKIPTKDIAKKLNRATRSIHCYAHLLDLSRQTKMRKWTQEEINFLRENYNKMNYREISERLGRSWHSVESELRKRLGITKFKHPIHRSWSADEVDFVEKNRNQMTKKEIARQLNRLYSSVYLKMRTLEKEPYSEWG